MDGYGSQLDYDCLTLTGRSISEHLGRGADGIVSLAHFAANLPADSATRMKESGYGGVDEWATRFKTNALLADIYDAMGAFLYAFACSRSKKKPKRPKPYPRPWAVEKGRRFGRGAIPVRYFQEWWDNA